MFVCCLTIMAILKRSSDFFCMIFLFGLLLNFAFTREAYNDRYHSTPSSPRPRLVLHHVFRSRLFNLNCSKVQPLGLTLSQSDETTNTVFIYLVCKPRSSRIPDKALGLCILYLSILLIANAGDVELNPGPKPACGLCDKTVRINQRGICCDSCNIWFHTKCKTSPQRHTKRYNPQT